MKLEDQVCTLKQAERLKELGVIQESLFCFIGDNNPDPQYFLKHEICLTEAARQDVGASWFENRIATFTVAELGVMLEGYERRVEKQSNGRFLILEKGLPDAFFYATDTEAEARASLLIFLIEKGIRSTITCNFNLLA